MTQPPVRSYALNLSEKAANGYRQPVGRQQGTEQSSQVIMLCLKRQAPSVQAPRVSAARSAVEI